MRRCLFSLVCNGFTYLAVMLIVAFLFAPSAFADCGCTPGYNCSARFCKANGGKTGCPSTCPITKVPATVQYVKVEPVVGLSANDFGAFDRRLTDLERRVAALEATQFVPLMQKSNSPQPPITVNPPYSLSIVDAYPSSQGTVCVGGSCQQVSGLAGETVVGSLFANRPKPLRRIVGAVLGGCGR